MTRSKNESLRAFPDERVAREMVLPFLREHFDTLEEVRASGPPGVTKYVFDAVTVCEGTGHVLAWEVKRSHLYKSEFADVLRQAIYYRLASIDDPRFSGLAGVRPAACVVFPNWEGLHDEGTLKYQREADGMRLLASHFRVGVLAEAPKYGGMSIIIGESAVWHSWSGWTGNAEGVLRGKRKLGSRRRVD